MKIVFPILIIIPCVIFMSTSCRSGDSTSYEKPEENANSEGQGKELELPEEISFNEHIRPIFNANCTACHGGVKKASDLSLIYRHLALGEAKSGLRPIVPNDTEASHLLTRIQTDDEDDLMPPPDHGPRLSEYDVALIERWIEEGAKWETHWAFEPPSISKPIGSGESLIDHYVAEQWQANSLEPADSAAPAELLRRMSFDLIGLPPSPEEIDAFEQDYALRGQEAVAAEADRLLASPHYGERWASVWMDLARYADSEGLGLDRRRTVWPYRDWLIRSFDNDMPFDEFTRKQIAGDLLQPAGVENLLATTFHRLTQANEEGGTDDEEFRVAAVMDRVHTTWEAWQGQTFSCVQCHSHPYDTFDHEEYYKFYAFFNNTQDSDTSNHFPTLSVPSEYEAYDSASEVLEKKEGRLSELLALTSDLRMQSSWQPLKNSTLVAKGTDASIEALESGDEIRASKALKKNTLYKVRWAPQDKRVDAIMIEAFPENEEAAAAFGENGFILGFVQLHRISAGGKKEKISLNRILPDRGPALGGWYSSLDSKTKAGWGAYAKMYQKRSAIITPEVSVELAEAEELELTLQFPQVYLASFPLVPHGIKISQSYGENWSSALEKYDELLVQYMQADKKLSKMGRNKVPVIQQLTTDTQRHTAMFVRGNWLDHGKEITKPDVPASLPKINAEQPTRVDLANWLVDGRNPLTSRVAVNRLWQQLFGRGIVETLEDFGSSGIPPTHPKLLDYLALRFQETYGWSQKKLLREIVLSKTYQLTAVVSEEVRELDPSNRFYSYGSRRRLRGEAVRDMSLSAAGLLSNKKFGPPVFPPIPPGVWKPFRRDDWSTPERGHEDRYRRAVYTYWKRSIPYPSMLAFDAPTREVCSKRRLVSNTPIAALTTLNDPAFEEFAEALAHRLLELSTKDIRAKLTYGYRLTTSRTPSAQTLDDLVDLYEQNLGENIDSETAQFSAMNLVASVLLNLDLALTK